MKYNKITDHKKHKTNPFIVELTNVQIKKRKVMVGQAGHVMVNTDTGEIEGQTIVASIREYDKETFVKVYTEGLKAMFDLSKSEQRVLLYTMSEARPNCDWIYFDTDDCIEFTGYSTKVPILSALAKLVEKKIVARSDKKHKIYINPTIFFNGNRVSFIKTAVLENNSEFTHISELMKDDIVSKLEG